MSRTVADVMTLTALTATVDEPLEVAAARMADHRIGSVVVVEGNRPIVVGPLQLGGTRHNSGAQFAQDQRDAIAMVASQDGRFTLFAWSPREGMVHAHRVEALLL